MNKPLINPLIWTSILGVMVVHFIYFQPALSPIFDSDGAIHVLMAQDFVFPQGLYFWGQDRLGSFVPMVSQPLVLLGIPGIWVLSFIQFSLLIVTFLNFAKDLSSLQKLSLSFLIFIPYYHWWFLVSTGQPYIPQLFFLSLIYRLFQDYSSWSAKHWWTFTLYGLLSIWISDLAITYVAVLALYKVYTERKSLNTTWTTHLLFQGCTSFLFMFFLLRVKTATTVSEEYQQLIGPPSEWISVVKNLFAFYSSEATHFTEHWISSLGILLVMASLVLFFYQNLKRVFQNPWFLSTLTILIATVISHWVFKNGLRYFTLPLSLIVLFTLLGSKKRDFIQWGLFMGLLALSTSSFVNRVSLERPAVFMPKSVDVKSFAQKVNYPAVGPYWTVYQYAAYAHPSPDVIAENFWNVRNKWDFEKVLNQDSILVFKSEKYTVLKDSLTIYNRPYKAISGPKVEGEIQARLYAPVNR